MQRNAIVAKKFGIHSLINGGSSMAYGFNENKTKCNVVPTPSFDSYTALINETTYTLNDSHTYYDHTFDQDCWVMIGLDATGGTTEKKLDIEAYYSTTNSRVIDTLATNGSHDSTGFFPVKAGTKFRFYRTSGNFTITVNEWV